MEITVPRYDNCLIVVGKFYHCVQYHFCVNISFCANVIPFSVFESRLEDNNVAGILQMGIKWGDRVASSLYTFYSSQHFSALVCNSFLLLVRSITGLFS